MNKIDLLQLKSNGRCAYCGRELNGSYHIEHMTPRDQGGSGRIYNLVLSCSSCNHRKCNKDVEQFRKYCSGETFAKQAQKYLERLEYFKDRIPDNVYSDVRQSYLGLLDTLGDFELEFYFESGDNKPYLDRYVEECQKTRWHKRCLKKNH